MGGNVNELGDIPGVAEWADPPGRTGDRRMEAIE